MRQVRFIIVIFVSWLGIAVYGQVQQGYVKTLGRPNHKGVALSGVSVRVKGGHNAVLSNAQGTFAMPMPDKKHGDSYALQQVQKQGYELNESGIIGRKYAYSAKVPLTIVMVSTKQLQADKQRIENNAYVVAERNYKIKLEELEKQKTANDITIEQYRQQLQDLQDKFEKYQSMIDGLADHYAHTDYDNLDATEREINQNIEDGDLEHAESLLQQIGIQQRIADIEKRKETGERMMAQAGKDMAAVLKQQEKDAEHLYQLYTIALARFDNEKARFFIETRAALDTTNVEWQVDAGRLNSDYLADYDKAMSFLERGLRQAIVQQGEQSEIVAMVYCNIGETFEPQRNYKLLLDYFQKSLDIRRALYQEPNLLLAASLAGVGSGYAFQGDYLKGQMLVEEALHIRQQFLPAKHLDIAESIFQLGYIYASQGNFADGIRNMEQANEIMMELYGEKYIHVADGYHNLGYLYMMTNSFDKAEEYLNKGLSLRRQLFGDKHPKVAESMNILGTIYQRTEKHPEALRCYQEVLNIRLELLGEMSPPVAIAYNNLGVIYGSMGDNQKLLEYTKKALAIHMVVSGEKHPDTGIAWLNLSDCYYNMEDWNQATDAATKGSVILISALGENHPNVSEAYQRLGLIFYKQKIYLEAIDYFCKAIDIWRKVYGNGFSSIAAISDIVDGCYQLYLIDHPDDQRVQKDYKTFLDNK